VHLVVVPTAEGRILTTADVHSASPHETDPDAANDWDTDAALVAAATSTTSTSTTTSTQPGASTTSSTTMPEPTSTTTTLPPGCDALVGLDGLTCVCRAGIARGACMGQHLPTVITRGFTTGCARVARLTAPASGRRAVKLARKAAATFDRIDRLAARGPVVRKLSPACAAALRSVLDDARAQADGLRTTR